MQVSQWFELVVFTASMEIYGTAVADKLDGNQGMLNRSGSLGFLLQSIQSELV